MRSHEERQYRVDQWSSLFILDMILPVLSTVYLIGFVVCDLKHTDVPLAEQMGLCR
jgi:hypothetical protein